MSDRCPAPCLDAYASILCRKFSSRNLSPLVGLFVPGTAVFDDHRYAGTAVLGVAFQRFKPPILPPKNEKSKIEKGCEISRMESRIDIQEI